MWTKSFQTSVGQTVSLSVGDDCKLSTLVFTRVPTVPESLPLASDVVFNKVGFTVIIEWNSL